MDFILFKDGKKKSKEYFVMSKMYKIQISMSNRNQVSLGPSHSPLVTPVSGCFMLER